MRHKTITWSPTFDTTIKAGSLLKSWIKAKLWRKNSAPSIIRQAAYSRSPMYGCQGGIWLLNGHALEQTAECNLLKNYI